MRYTPMTMKTTALAWLVAAFVMAATVVNPCDGALRGGPPLPQRNGFADKGDVHHDLDAEEENGHADRHLQSGNNIELEPFGLWLGPTYRRSTIQGVVITNGRIVLGVSPAGNLNVLPNFNERPPVTNQIAMRRLIPDDEIAVGNMGEPKRDGSPSFQLEVVASASPCEGWGLSVDGDSLETGATNMYFNRCRGQTQCDSRFRETFCSYAEVAPFDDPDWAGGDSVYSARPFVNATTAVIMHDSTNRTDPNRRDKLLVTRDFRPSDVTDDIYVTDVTITNLWDQDITQVKYRQTIDFDVYPSRFRECMTIHPDPALVEYWDNGTNDGFQTSNPLVPLTDRLGIAPITDYAMADYDPSIPYPEPGSIKPDQGAAFDFTFPDIPVGGSFQFKYFYGAFKSVFDAQLTMIAEGVEMYAIGMPRTPEGDCAAGPNVFMVGFSNVGGEKISHAPSMMPSVSLAPTVSSSPTGSSSPSQAPTTSAAPSKSPTESPTTSNRPTESLTESPTTFPVSFFLFESEPPTNSPTESPTNSPTESPTESPTKSPTESPTKSPTKSPTESPTELPSESPSCTPFGLDPILGQVVFVSGAQGSTSNNGEFTVTVTGGESLTYGWETDCPGAILSNPMAQSTTLDIASGTEPTVCSITVQVCNSCGCLSRTGIVTIVDPSAGFVTGGGWIESPEGSLVFEPSVVGKASFGFVSKYKKGASVPTGSTQFTFMTPKFSFHSNDYEWLVVTGSDCAKYKGSGRVKYNGVFTYDRGFMLTTCDNGEPGKGVDTFRIHIWDKADDSTIYDNQMGVDEDSYEGTTIDGGNIQIHRKE